MNKVLCGTLLALCTMLDGCAASHSGCFAEACERPDSNDRELVIWWPADMRQGLEARERTLDFTVVPLRD